MSEWASHGHTLQIEYIARLVEEEELEEQDKTDGVKGMLEGHGSVSTLNVSSSPSPLTEDSACSYRKQ
jgi:hypothetical protein